MDAPVNALQFERLSQLADMIRASHKWALKHVAETVTRAALAGEHLIEAKRLVGHGQWLPWLRDNCSMSERTAQLYMRVARNKDTIAKSASSVADLTLTAAVAGIAKPKAVAVELPITKAEAALIEEIEGGPKVEARSRSRSVRAPQLSEPPDRLPTIVAGWRYGYGNAVRASAPDVAAERQLINDLLDDIEAKRKPDVQVTPRFKKARR
jgi:Protein of unknown function (DUF3102)